MGPLGEDSEEPLLWELSHDGAITDFNEGTHLGIRVRIRYVYE